MYDKREDVGKILSLLKNKYPNAKTPLKFKNKFTLLIAVLLSAQCTDKNVNNVTKNIFDKYFKPEHFAKLGVQKIKKLIKSIGLYNNKSKNIYNLSKKLILNHNSKVPKKFEDLIKLPGVGRKTANVVLNEAFNMPTIGVDTHIFRVANRTKIAPGKNAFEVEVNLKKITPIKYLKNTHHLLLFHGRYTCKARVPQCKECIIKKYCKFKYKEK